MLCVCGAVLPNNIRMCPRCGKTINERDANIQRADRTRCPECGTGLIYQEGCHYCTACGWSACGG